MPETQRDNTNTPPLVAHQFANFEDFGRLKKDFSLILMALELKEECHAPKVADTLRCALKWLQKKKETTPTHPFFRWHENIHAFLNCFPSEILATLDLVFIDDKKEWLLQAMQDSPALTKITITDSRCLNNRFSYFLEHAMHLKEINLELTSPLCLGSAALIALIYGLDQNTTLEEIVLKGQIDNADCLGYLLETSKKSKNIRRLDLRECKMSEACYQAIKTFMKNIINFEILFDSDNLLATHVNHGLLNCISSTPAMPAFTPHYSRRITNIGMPFSPEIIAQADAEIAAITERMVSLY